MTETKPIAVGLVSGGMDSCVAAAQALSDGYDLACLHGCYGQRTARRELSCFHAIADRLGISRGRRLVVELAHLGSVGGSSLTDPSMRIAVSPLAGALREAGGPGRGGMVVATPGGADRAGVGHAAIPSSYVPFRNAHFLTAAVSWAETLGASAIYVGAVEEDSSGYPDCREEYFRAFEKVIDLGTRPETKIRIVTPLIHLDKAEIVTRGLELGAPFELTWSCYSENDLACGVCDSCALRLRGFSRAGAVDPIPYASLR